MYMEQKPFLFQGYHPVAPLEPSVAFKHLFTDGAELGIRESDAVIVHGPFLSRLGKAVEPGYPLSEMVGKEYKRKEGYHKQGDDQYEKQCVRLEESPDIHLIRESHPDDKAAI